MFNLKLFRCCHDIFISGLANHSVTLLEQVLECCNKNSGRQRFADGATRSYDACHILTCSCDILSAFRDSAVKSLCDKLRNLDGDPVAIELVISFMLAPPSSTPDSRRLLSSLLSQFPLRTLQHGFFPKIFVEAVHPDLLRAREIASKWIRLTISTLHLLWLKRCEIVHCKLDGETAINDAIELQQEVEDMLQEPEYLHVLPSHMLNINPKDMSPTDLRAWLFETFTLCKDFKACEELNTKVKSSFEFTQSPLLEDSIDLRMTLFQIEENLS